MGTLGFLMVHKAISFPMGIHFKQFLITIISTLAFPLYACITAFYSSLFQILFHRFPPKHFSNNSAFGYYYHIIGRMARKKYYSAAWYNNTSNIPALWDFCPFP